MSARSSSFSAGEDGNGGLPGLTRRGLLRSACFQVVGAHGRVSTARGRRFVGVLLVFLLAVVCDEAVSPPSSIFFRESGEVGGEGLMLPPPSVSFFSATRYVPGGILAGDT